MDACRKRLYNRFIHNFLYREASPRPGPSSSGVKDSMLGQAKKQAVGGPSNQLGRNILTIVYIYSHILEWRLKIIVRRSFLTMVYHEYVHVNY